MHVIQIKESKKEKEEHRMFTLVLSDRGTKNKKATLVIIRRMHDLGPMYTKTKIFEPIDTMSAEYSNMFKRSKSFKLWRV